MIRFKMLVYVFVFSLFYLSTPNALMAGDIGEIFDDPATDVSSSYIDIISSKALLTGELLTGIFSLANIPDTIIFSRTGVPPDYFEYAWSINIDVDDNKKTGFDVSGAFGIDYQLSATSFVGIFEVDEGENLARPIADGVQVNTWITTESGSNYLEEASIVVDNLSNTITLMGSIPGISLNSKIYFSAFDYNPGGMSETDIVDEMLDTDNDNGAGNLILYSDFENGQMPVYLDWGKNVKLTQPINTDIENGSLIVSPNQNVPEGRFSFGNGASVIQFEFNIRDVSFDTYNLDINLIHSSLQQTSDSEIFVAITSRQYDTSSTCFIQFDVFTLDKETNVYTHIYGKNVGTISYGVNYKSRFEWVNNTISFYLDDNLLDQYKLNFENLYPLENPYNKPGYFVSDIDKNRIGNASFKLTIDNIYTNIDYNSLKQQSVFILTDTSPDATISENTTAQVYGTAGGNNITIESGAEAKLINFPGTNSIQILSSSDLFTVSRSGTVVIFQGTDGTMLKVPATKDIQTVSFNGEVSRVLQIHNSQVMLDDQVIGLDETPISELFINRFTTEPPVIDGNIGINEWKSASQVTLKSLEGTQCIFYIMHDDNHVYVAVSAIDDITNTTPSETWSTGIFDNIAIWFGREGADVLSEETGYGYWLYGNSYLRTEKIDLKNNQSISFQSAAESSVTAPPSAAHMSYELKIPKGEILDVITNGSTKAGIHYWNDYNSGPSFWGPSNVSVFDIETYARMVFQ